MENENGYQWSQDSHVYFVVVGFTKGAMSNNNLQTYDHNPQN